LEAGQGLGPKTLVSTTAACCWIPLFALRCEETRQPDLAGKPLALLAPELTRRMWLVSPIARREGVRPGMTVGQAIGLCPSLRLLEPDPVHYDEQFAHLVAALGDISPAVEAVELGRVFVGTDGMEGLYGSTETIVATIQNVVVDSRLRLGWGRGKFIAATAANRARPGQPVIVSPSSEKNFLASQSVSTLPLDLDTHRRLRMLGIRTLGQLAALPEDAVTSQFGRDGRRLWRLAAGKTIEPVTGKLEPEPIRTSLSFYAPVADRTMIARSLGQLIDRALKHPRRLGWRVQALRASAALEQGASWCAAALLKEPVADRERLLAPLLLRLEHAPPLGAVERLTVELTAFTPGTQELQLFARDAAAAARAGRRRALRAAAQEITARLRRPMLYHVIEIEPWSRIPERRYALIDFDP
jgi:nucleotidyltransferase/DNA polymerase involved in DNA repair